MKYKLFIENFCPFCIKVIKHIQEKNLNDNFEIINIKNSEHQEILSQVGHIKQVPCILINGDLIYESMDIIKWIDDNF